MVLCRTKGLPFFAGFCRRLGVLFWLWRWGWLVWRRWFGWGFRCCGWMSGGNSIGIFFGGSCSTGRFFYNGAAAALACILAIPPAIVVGRGRGVLSKIFTLLIPLSLALPSIAYAYGWIQFCRIHDCLPSPDTWGDVARCVGTLAGWLWGIPAILIGLSLRGLDPNVQLAAMLDGRLWRITFRLLRLPILASFAMVMALAMQEFGGL